MVTTENILFSVPTFTVPANYKIIETPARPEYLHITTSTISVINLRIVDENDKLYNFKSEKIVIKLHITHITSSGAGSKSATWPRTLKIIVVALSA